MEKITIYKNDLMKTPIFENKKNNNNCIQNKKIKIINNSKDKNSFDK